MVRQAVRLYIVGRATQNVDSAMSPAVMGVPALGLSSQGWLVRATEEERGRKPRLQPRRLPELEIPGAVLIDQFPVVLHAQAGALGHGYAALGIDGIQTIPVVGGVDDI